MDFFSAMRVAASGLSVQRTRMNVTSSNLANAETTRTVEGGPYRRRTAVVAAVPLSETFQEVLGEALHDQTASAEVVAIEADRGPGRMVYDPEHPDANRDGYVEMPNINVIDEMTDLITASRSYEASVSAMQSLKGMARSALSIGE